MIERDVIGQVDLVPNLMLFRTLLIMEEPINFFLLLLNSFIFHILAFHCLKDFNFLKGTSIHLNPHIDRDPSVI